MLSWNPDLRSKTAIRTSDTRYFVDSSIATASLGSGPNDLVGDLNTMGLLFETMCVRDLRVSKRFWMVMFIIAEINPGLNVTQ